MAPHRGPLLAAATAWAALSEDLATSATAVSSVISAVAGSAWHPRSTASSRVCRPGTPTSPTPSRARPRRLTRLCFRPQTP
ncbi:PPE domain-containing protein [Mycobacterium persicum]|uniref:PPE domain-containing protein n=1 Tax=Mycobacterium persicum TaxID=1487726 RepID=UPI000A0A018F|nr:hypothetical protein BST40_05640 [Mycobacterium persicum]ORB91370.1 hypothetical protein B1T49_21485 [Mycobacterium persicum]ORB96667.1 hypothetical protein B1T44_21645 [Mycobacterium persicum]ORC03376.1 hypothetical protein B1T48_21210 [Mycobacterium persicum]